MSAAEMLTPLPKIVREDLDNSEHYEIVDGVRVELPPMSAESSGVAAELATFLTTYGLANDQGKAYPEMLIKLALPVDRNRRPDVIFVPFTRWPRHVRRPDSNAWDVQPTLCVEVVSPNDGAEEVETKVEEYLRAGIPLVWVIYPENERVYVYDSPSHVRRLTRADTLDGGTVLPGFAVPLSELFLQPPPAANPPAKP